MYQADGNLEQCLTSALDECIAQCWEEGTAAVSILCFPCKETAAQTKGKRKQENAKQMPCGTL